MKEYLLKTKVCIVGSGFCGYAAYKKLKSHNIELIVVEGGSDKTPQKSSDQSFYKVNTNRSFSFSNNTVLSNLFVSISASFILKVFGGTAKVTN